VAGRAGAHFGKLLIVFFDVAAGCAALTFWRAAATCFLLDIAPPYLAEVGIREATTTEMTQRQRAP
jgi:hypothetical protein